MQIPLNFGHLYPCKGFHFPCMSFRAVKGRDSFAQLPSRKTRARPSGFQTKPKLPPFIYAKQPCGRGPELDGA